MKYLKSYQSKRPVKKFYTGDIVTPLKDTKNVRSNKAYMITGEYTPEFCVTVLKYNGWAYGLKTENEYDTIIVKESELRQPTPQELEIYELEKDTNKYNL